MECSNKTAYHSVITAGRLQSLEGPIIIAFVTCSQDHKWHKLIFFFWAGLEGLCS